MLVVSPSAVTTLTLDAQQLLARMQDPGYRNDGREVVLTFDDGLRLTFSLLPTEFASLRKKPVFQLTIVALDLVKAKEGIPYQALIGDHLAKKNTKGAGGDPCPE